MSTPSRFRRDVEGLRALAIGFVLIYHAGVSAIPGGFIGVDIFFVLSGFLITGLLVREVESSGTISLPRFYARRAKRLLPASALVLVTTAILTWQFTSVVTWRDIGTEITAAAAYLVNWLFAAQSVDYLAEGSGASPVQHFWSLAVEEQFYIIWPILLLLVTLVARRRASLNLRRTMFWALLLVVIPSFLSSLLWTAHDPSVAFFVTPTRLWELGIGGLVALGAHHWQRISGRTAAIAAWTGLVALLAGAFLLDSTVPWPSSWALVPTLGTAAVIIGGYASRPGTPTQILGMRPLVWIGGLSYSLYLWHWPILVTAKSALGELGPWLSVAIVLLTFIPAWLSYRFVENPVRNARSLNDSRLALSVGLNLTAVSALAGIALILAVPSSTTTTEGTSINSLGANVLTVPKNQPDARPDIPHPDTADQVIPAPSDAVDDVPAAYENGCQVDQQSTTISPCVIGDPAGSVEIALIGDSKALQWESALDSIGHELGWRIETLTKSSCPFSSAGAQLAGEPYASCDTYNRAVREYLVGSEGPDAVIVSGYAARAYDEHGAYIEEAAVAGQTEAWQALENSGIEVLALLDNPHPVSIPDSENQVYGCVAENLDSLRACSFTTADGIEASGSPSMREAANATDSVDVVDMNDWICSTSVCPAVIGNVLVYRQGSHLTDTYVRTLTAHLEDQLRPLLDER